MFEEFVELDLVVQAIAGTLAFEAFETAAFIGGGPQIFVVPAAGGYGRQVPEELAFGVGGSAEIVERNPLHP